MTGKVARFNPVSIERLERRTCLSIATIGSASGAVFYQYALSDGNAAQVPLVDRWVYDDVDNSGSYQLGDPVAQTNLQGQYTISLASESETLRLLPRAGWSAVVDSQSAQPGAVIPTFFEQMNTPIVVDVLAAYTASATSAYGSVTPATIANLFSYTNQVLADSDTNVRVNLVTTLETNYGESGSFYNDLDALAKGRVTDIAVAHRATGSDLTVLFEGDINRNGGGEVGLSLEFNRAHPNASQGDAIVSLLGNLTQDGNTLAHELGHTLGADHDPADAHTPGTLPYARGLIFTGTDGATYRDVMSYGTSTILPFYSTPTAFYDGHPLGKSSNGDNARAIRLNAPLVARYSVNGLEGPSEDSTLALAPATILQSLKILGKPKAVMIGGTVTKAAVTLTNAGPGLIHASATFYLALVNQNSTSTASDTLLDFRVVPVVLRPGQSRLIPLQLTWPASMDEGNYQLALTTIAASEFALDAQGQGPLTAVNVTYQHAKIRLSLVAASPAMLLVHSGKLFSVQVLLLNQGNVSAIGSGLFDAVLSTSPATALAIRTTRFSIPANTTRWIRLNLTIPVGTPVGTYALMIDLTPATAVADDGQGNTTFTIGLSVV